MTLRRVVSGLAVAAIVAAGVYPSAASQEPASAGPSARQPQQSAGSEPQERLDLPPVSLDRIREAVQREPAIRLPEPQGPVFTVTVEGRLPSFSDFVGAENLARGPAPATSMTHREFLSLVAPPQTQSFGAFTPGELLQVAATSAAFALGSQWLVQGIKDAIRNKREREAREEVQAVLAELERREREKKKEEDGRPREP